METSEQITVVLADDHNVIRAGLRSMLEAEPRPAGDRRGRRRGRGREAGPRPPPRRAGARPADAGRRAGAATSRACARALPATAIVVLTMQSDPRRARDLLRAGAAGYVLKQAAERKLTEAIRTAAGGGSYIDPELGGALAKLEADPLEELSERERELLRLLALGHTNREIGEQLFLSVRAIEVNRAKLLREARDRVAPGAGPLRDRQRRHRAGGDASLRLSRLHRNPGRDPRCRRRGSERTSISPPSSSIRSRIPIRPRPSPTELGSNPPPSSSTAISHRAGRPGARIRRRWRAAACLRRC